jgi:cyanophycinase
MAIGGGEMADARQVLDELIPALKTSPDARVVVVTVATEDDEKAASKYNALFRGRGIKHVDTVHINQRDDAFNERSIAKIRDARGIFFTGGDQLNVTSLMGGSPVHNLIHERLEAGVLVAGTSAGAAMMSSSMIITGESDSAPKVGGVEIAPGMNMVENSIIDSHFSQRGRHGRLLTAVAHFPQVLGLGIDERTAAIFTNGGFKVVGEGVVTVVDGSQMRHSDLPYRKDDENIGMFGATIHVLPHGYSYLLKERQPVAPELRKMAGNNDED